MDDVADAKRTATQGAAGLEERLERYVRYDRANRPYLAWQLEQFAPWLGRRILEVGCGVGGMTELLGPRELLYCIDVEPEILAHAERRFADRSECRFALLDVGNIPDERLAELRSLRFDSIVCSNVLEHVRDDAGTLRRLAGILVPGGALALLVPAHPALYGAYDRLDGHFRRYARAPLRQALEAAGLRVRRLHYLNAPGALGWWIQYRLLRRQVHGPAQLGAMNRILPWVRALESRVHPPFGLSLVAVAERPGEDAPR